MSLTVQLKNIGILKQAEFSLGDLTLICGENNTGKTYIAYTLYGFLNSWSNAGYISSISEDQIHSLLTHGALKIELTQYVEQANQVPIAACERYPKLLDEIFAAPEGTFHNSEFHIDAGENNIRNKEINGRLRTAQDGNFGYSKHEDSEILTVTMEMEKERRKIDPHFVRILLELIILRAFFSDSLPRPFICSVERTGTAIFRKELNFARNRLLNRLLEEIGRVDQKANVQELLFKAYQNYPQPVKNNVDFSRQLEDIAKNKSFIAKEHPEILEDFAGIVGGKYVITQNDQLYYIPKGTRSKLTMVESSSTARALLDLSFYLNCIAEKGDLLMIDEPELSLHPENQRRIARLFARLANLGVKVFITTHSDYIIKELNTLIMLNHDKPHLKRVAEENGYQDSELISVDQVKVYIAEKALLPLEKGQKRRKRGHTLVPAKIHPELGIGVSSFDKTIDDMNRIQDDIVWAEE